MTEIAKVEQQDMFSPANIEKSLKMISDPKTLVRRTDPDTSIDAACLLEAGGLEEKVYHVIKAFGAAGCIGDDVVKAMPDYGVQTISPRYAKLIEKGFIEDTGERRKALSGRGQRVMRSIA